MIISGFEPQSNTLDLALSMVRVLRDTFNLTFGTFCLFPLEQRSYVFLSQVRSQACPHQRPSSPSPTFSPGALSQVPPG